MNIVSTRNSEHYKWGNNSDGWHLLKSDSLSVIQENVPPNKREHRHYHNESQQFFYVLSGSVHIEVRGEMFEIHAGNGIHVPPKAPHQLMNNGSTDVQFLVISQPKSHGDRYNA